MYWGIPTCFMAFAQHLSIHLFCQAVYQRRLTRNPSGFAVALQFFSN